MKAGVYIKKKRILSAPYMHDLPILITRIIVLGDAFCVVVVELECCRAV